VKLSKELKRVVNQALHILGEELKRAHGDRHFKEIEKIRVDMAALRTADAESTAKALWKLKSRLVKGGKDQQRVVAHAFALMMEIMNACEHAYRTFRIQEVSKESINELPEEIIFVVTAHPTEARSSESVALFKKIQRDLEHVFLFGWKDFEQAFREKVCALVHVPLAPQEKPTPLDEARYLYGLILESSNLQAILDREDLAKRVRFRAWVGGDKDGHPGVDEKVFMGSLSISRDILVGRLEEYLAAVEDLFESSQSYPSSTIESVRRQLQKCRHLGPGDYALVEKLKLSIAKLKAELHKKLGLKLTAVSRMERLLELFPALVVPLEFRESADVLSEAVKVSRVDAEDFAIVRMLKALRSLAPVDARRFYVQAFIISMVSCSEDLHNALELEKRHLSELSIPVVPLFETRQALEESAAILKDFLRSEKPYLDHLKKHWKRRVEMMLGYSDSAKESGVLASRVLIARSMRTLEEMLSGKKLCPVFFHGTGGSIARGGGNVNEQIAWWGAEARKIYKVTVQGEMVARTFASPALLTRHVAKISAACSRKAKKYRHSQLVDDLAAANADVYSDTIANPDFLRLVELSTIYKFLHHLKVGSRPAKRRELSGIGDLRAIPWVLCWTQLRLLLPSWWGFAQSYEKLSSEEKLALAAQVGKDPVLTSFLKQLGFTLAKVELAPLTLALQRGLGAEAAEEYRSLFEREFRKTRRVLKHLAGEGNFTSLQPWLSDSIYLRRTMIFPLNVLQEIALEKKDSSLLRQTVTGISSGMLTTG
jgi:phosphoenolpyruvate carboxylase